MSLGRLYSPLVLCSYSGRNTVPGFVKKVTSVGLAYNLRMVGVMWVGEYPVELGTKGKYLLLLLL